LPITPATAITGVLEAWHHTGLAVDHSLVTAATTSGTVTLGASHRRGRYEALPFVRLRGGSIDTGLERGAASGWSAGLTLSTRF
jgi:hypothetical protein